MSSCAILPLPSAHFVDHAIYVSGVLAGFILGPTALTTSYFIDSSVRPDLLPDATGQAACHDTYAEAAAFVTHLVDRRLAA